MFSCGIFGEVNLIPKRIRKKEYKEYDENRMILTLNGSCEGFLETREEEWKLLKFHCEGLVEIIDKEKLMELIETTASVFTVPWYGQLMNGPQILAYLYMVNLWLEKNNVDIEK